MYSALKIIKDYHLKLNLKIIEFIVVTSFNVIYNYLHYSKIKIFEKYFCTDLFSNIFKEFCCNFF